MISLQKIIVGILFYGLCCWASSGDEVHLKNGNNLTGKVVRQDDNEVVLETEFSGPIAIQRSFITELSIEPEAPVGVTHTENSQNPETGGWEEVEVPDGYWEVVPCD